MKVFEKNSNDLRFACSLIQMQLDVASEISQSSYWKVVNDIIRSITPNISIKGDSK